MNINFLSLILSALVPMIVGFIWYHEKVFGKIWMDSTGMTQESMKNVNMIKLFGFSFLAALIAAFSMNLIAYHDAFVGGSLYYETKGALPGSDTPAGVWYNQYLQNYAASNHTFKHGAFHGMMIGGLLIAFPVILTDSLYEQKPWKVIFIKAGYWILCMALMGGITAAMAK